MASKVFYPLYIFPPHEFDVLCPMIRLYYLHGTVEFKIWKLSGWALLSRVNPLKNESFLQLVLKAEFRVKHQKDFMCFCWLENGVSNMANSRQCVIAPQSWFLCSDFLTYFFLCVSDWIISVQLLSSSLVFSFGYDKSIDITIKGMLHLPYVVLFCFPAFPLDSFLIVSIDPLKSPIGLACCLLSPLKP